MPKSYLEYLVFDISFVLRRAMLSFIEISIISLRYSRILLLLFPAYMLKKTRYNKYDRLTNFGLYALTGILTYATILPGLVQHRWLFPFYVIIIYCFVAKFKRNKSFITLFSYEFNLVLINVIIIWFFEKKISFWCLTKLKY